MSSKNASQLDGWVTNSSIFIVKWLKIPFSTWIDWLDSAKKTKMTKTSQSIIFLWDALFVKAG